jgi:cytochrome c-type biogenesis protein CcmH
LNIIFILLAASLVLIALLIIIAPLWRSGGVHSIDINARNATIANQQLDELTSQLQAGAISPQDYEAQRSELELVLSDNLDNNSNKPTFIKNRAIVYVLIIIIPVLATALYSYLGVFQAIEPTPVMLNAANNSQTPNLADIGKMVQKLADHAKANPQDSKAWTMLGKSYKYLQNYPAAAEAFAHAYSLLGEQPEIMLLYADALAFAQDEQLAGKPAELVFKALEKEPTNIQGLWLGGMAKAQAGDLAQALSLWKKLESLLPDNSAEKRETQQLLAKLESQLTEGITNQPEEPIKQTNAAAEINVQVSLADNLKALANPNDSVFIYAQANAAQKMPLAVIRKQVKDLPLTASLNDSLAMMPSMKVSSFDKVIISARISKSGQAITQAGDLIGTLNNISVLDKTSHNLVINEQVK